MTEEISEFIKSIDSGEPRKSIFPGIDALRDIFLCSETPIGRDPQSMMLVTMTFHLSELYGPKWREHILDKLIEARERTLAAFQKAEREILQYPQSI